jgi:ubiquinone biosynthesis protein
MLKSAGHIFRLIRAGRVLARHQALLPHEELGDLPQPARLALRILSLGRPQKGVSEGASPLVSALTELGPSYIKLGQFFATRPDIIGVQWADKLAELQDNLAPFDHQAAQAEVETGLGAPLTTLFAEFGPPVAAASIAQVHKARVSQASLSQADAPLREVAVKVLRPNIERRFQADLDSFFFAARLIERWHPPSRRLRPVDAVATLAQSVKLEMDLRMEAAAISEMTENTRDDPGIRLPAVDWQRTARRVLTTEWIDGIALSSPEKIRAAGFDVEALADGLIQNFLRHAIRDGFFHADMHPGNLFIDPEGRLVPVDFGIMGRLGMKERRFLAEILYGFITRNYARVSAVHFEAGYVPADHDPAVFAQALRAIGEPLMDKRASEISMARLLSQLLQVTDQFDMRTQPQLLLLQKTMVVVEGVARTLNPQFNMWLAAEPVVRSWVEERLGPQGRMEEAAEGAAAVGRLIGALPEVLGEAQRTAHMLGAMADRGGIRLDQETTESLAQAQARHGRSGRIAMWIGALALAAIALALAGALHY